MAGKQIAGDSFTSNLAGMSKNQLYDIMSQMKNQQQARQILVENPLLTKALFQAQIMLGMVQPPQLMPNIQQSLSQHSQQSVQTGQQLNVQAAHSLPIQVGQQDQASASQTQIPVRKQHQNQPAMPLPPASVPPVTHQSQPMPSHSLQKVQQAKGHLNSAMTSMSLPQSSQIHAIPSLPLHSAPQMPPLLPPQLPAISSQSQQSMQTTGVPHLPLQPPLPPQPRPPSMPPFPHQLHSQMGPNLGYQPSGAPQPHLSQPTFHSVTKPPVTIGSTFPQGQPPLPSQPPPQSLYQVGGSHLVEYSQAGSSMQVERGGAWVHSPADNATGMQLPGPPPLVPGHIGAGSQPPRPPQLTPEMEKALLQQVMSLTPEQINLLPPEQRHQVLQLQQMLR
ncbi:PREDICTED: YLP motif-containing protein 1 isoform X2 [Nelumbo nucifera]|uniref:Cleavage stimulating factor 64-like n=2 Tax=Nelumbo nucifera TaxID=4432 RepID=A0A822YH68_NELNU|nr:PREDICTED: YLP motif-containing protein 1 isoform X2 [Nelumbo nucifera]DAD31792.1 TPA_asm: hypothetical protein HUJ06_010643 [Nelumbo nucifera]